MYRIFVFFTFGHKITLFFAYTQEKKDFFCKKSSKFAAELGIFELTKNKII